MFLMWNQIQDMDIHSQLEARRMVEKFGGYPTSDNFNSISKALLKKMKKYKNKPNITLM